MGGSVRVFTMTPTTAFKVNTQHIAPKIPRFGTSYLPEGQNPALVGIVKIHLVIDRMWYDIWIFERLGLKRIATR